jgi:hypothetical protein
MSSQAWTSALDRIEADLVAIEDALGTGRPVPACGTVELPTEALPEVLGTRAAALLDRTHALEARATEEIDGIRDCLRALAGRRPPAPAPTGRIVDVGA